MKYVEDSEYKCSLGMSTLDKAKTELGEQPDSRLLEVKNLRKRLEKVPGLKSRTDFGFLLAFLRGRKFDQEKAFKLIKRHYEQRFENSAVYDDLKPSSLPHVIDDKFIEVLQHRNKDGCRVVIVRPGKWEPDRYQPTELIKMLYLVLFKLCEDEETQVHGVHIIDLLDTISWKQASHMTPSLAKLMTATLQDMLPLRLKRYDFAHEPSFFHVIFPIFKSFMKDKLIQRIHLNGTKYDDIHKVISPDHLPTDLGGKLEPFGPYYKEWMTKLLEAEKDFEYNNRFGFVSMSLENDRKESGKEDAGLQGLGGTFKKLDV